MSKTAACHSAAFERKSGRRLMLQADVLIVGSGAAGMYAAIAAARAGAQALLVDRSLIGRGGATVMAQMTVAVAVGEEEPDHWEHHLADTLKAGRGICDADLSQLLCEDGPACIREMDEWGVGWARRDGHMAQVHAPGHDRKRCVYVDFLNTGPAVSKTLRARVQHMPEVQRVGDLLITELAMRDGVCVGAHATHVSTGAAVPIAAKATIVATGGLTRLYARNSASLNMGGDGTHSPCARAPSSSTWSSCSSFPSATSRRGWWAWTRSCGTRSATSWAAGSSTLK